MSQARVVETVVSVFTLCWWRSRRADELQQWQWLSVVTLCYFVLQVIGWGFDCGCGVCHLCVCACIVYLCNVCGSQLMDCVSICVVVAMGVWIFLCVSGAVWCNC